VNVQDDDGKASGVEMTKHLKMCEVLNMALGLTQGDDSIVR